VTPALLEKYLVFLKNQPKQTRHFAGCLRLQESVFVSSGSFFVYFWEYTPKIG